MTMRERIALAREVTRTKQRCNSRDVRLESKPHQVEVKFDVIVEHVLSYFVLEPSYSHVISPYPDLACLPV